MTVNLAIGQVTTPVGVNLCVAYSVAHLKLEEIARAVWPLVLVSLVALVAVSLVPGLSLWLPSLMVRR